MSKRKSLYLVGLVILIMISCKPTHIVPPQSPFLQSKRSAGEVHLFWGFPIYDWGFPIEGTRLKIAGFEIFMSVDDTFRYQSVEVVGSEEESLTVSGLVNGRSYFFKMISFDLGGNCSEFSNEIQVVPGQREEILMITETPDIHKMMPTWAPDESKIAFASIEDRDSTHLWDIYVLNLESMEKTRLTFQPGDAFSPEWSPNGEFIAFTAYWDGHDNYDIWTVTPDGKEFYQVTTYTDLDCSPTCSPDASKIAYVSRVANKRELWCALISDEAPKRLVSEFWQVKDPEWSPDGSKIAFSASNGEGFDIYYVSMENETIHNTISSKWHDDNPTWSPDGSKIAFVSDRSGCDEIWIYSFEDTKLTQITGWYPQSKYHIEWAPNSDFIIFDSHDGNLYIVKVH